MEQPTVTEISKEAGSITLRLFVSPSLPFFQGHFPQMPILPGVVMLNWAESYGREHFNIKIPFCGVDNLKFQQVVFPSSHIDLVLTYCAVKHQLEFSYFTAESRHAFGRIKFKP